MWKLFKRYRRRLDGNTWTKNTLLARMLSEINNENIISKSNGNIWIINKDFDLKIEFGSSNYADTDKVDLIAGLFFGNKSEAIWDSLFTVCKKVYGNKYRNLIIYKDEEFEGSTIQKECVEVYAPLTSLLQNNHKLAELIKGEPFTLGGKEITMEKIDDLKYFNDLLSNS